MVLYIIVEKTIKHLEGEILIKDNFDIFLPFNKIEKSKDKDVKKNVFVAGWASTPALDYQGERLDSFGLDASYLFKNGFVDYEHDREKVIGYPTSKSFVDPQKGLYVEAELFGDMPEVQNVLKLNNNLKKSQANRKLGFSIEGKVVKRDPVDKSIVRQVMVTGVAVTKNPANPEATWEQVQKSNAMTAGTGASPDTQRNGGALRPESMASEIVNLATRIREMEACVPDLDVFVKDTASALDSRGANDALIYQIFLQLFSGYSAEDALKLIPNSVLAHNVSPDTL